jgi:hypothetical protein
VFNELFLSATCLSNQLCRIKKEIRMLP